MITLENDQLIVKIAEIGAEVKSVIDKTTELEYIWQADAAYWGRSTPILFPIVGRLNNDTYYHKGQKFHLSQHGFARDLVFECDALSNTQASFVLKANAETKAKYPFDFILRVSYELENTELRVLWQVKNPSENETLHFSIGGHPAFNLKMFDADVVEDYYLLFDQAFSMQTVVLADGCFTDNKNNLGTSDSLRLVDDLFVNDALIFSDVPFEIVSLRNVRNSHGVEIDLSKFVYKNEKPLLGIWSPYKDGGIAPFVCLEPWFGHADFQNISLEISDKIGIIKLEANELFRTEQSWRFF